MPEEKKENETAGQNARPFFPVGTQQPANRFYYILADEKLTIDAAMNYFENNRKLLIIIITKEGKDTSRPHCIITQADIIDMKKILDVY